MKERYEAPHAEVIGFNEKDTAITALTASTDGNSILAAWLRGEVE